MRVLIREVTRRDDGTLEYRDTELTGDQVTIGASTDQSFVLTGAGVSLRHARLRRRRDGSSEITNVGTGELRINGETAASAKIEVGDKIEIGPHKAKCVAPPPGFDLSLEIEIAERGAKGKWLVPSEQEEARKGVGARGWSWLLGLFFLGSGLMIPLIGVYMPPVQAILRKAPFLPSDGWWNPGVLIPEHSTPPAGGNCTACHRTPFEQVRNEDCGVCHPNVTGHAATDTSIGSNLAARRCALCHREHRGAALIIRRDSELCVDCHGGLKSSLGEKAELEDVRDFATEHPDFRLTLLRPRDEPQGGGWESVRAALDSPDARDESNLKFNHKIHLDPNGIDTPDGKKRLACSNCHYLEESGMAMIPIDMKAHCSECHTLQFENVSLPHGSVEQVMLILRGYHQRNRPAPNVNRRQDVMQRPIARRPGEMEEAAASTPEEKIQRAARDLFERTLCKVCHEIKKLNLQGEAGWEVKPVRLNQTWMPKAHFSHKSHLQIKCVDCHSAENSEKREDLLMPGIKVCRKCHAGSSTSSGIPSTCAVCHRFHLPGMPALTGDQEKPPGV